MSGRRLTVIAMISFVLVALVLIAYAIVFPVPRFPTPTGAHPIGVRSYHWVDASRPEPFTADADDHRELAVQVWYPAAAANGGGPARYLRSRELRDALAGFFRLPGFLFHNVERAPTHAVEDAPAAAGRFPVLLNPTGFIGYSDASLFWIEELVSHGYVVVGVDQPGTAAATVLSDGRVVLAMDRDAFDRYMPWALSQGRGDAPELNGVDLPGGVVPFLAQDMRFVLTRTWELDAVDPLLSDHIDTTRAGIFGVSLGGYVGPETCRIDDRFGACLVADAGQTAEVAEQGLPQPVMILSRDADSFRRERDRAGGWPEDEIVHTIEAQQALFERSSAASYYLRMNDMFHLNWTDAPILTPIVRRFGLAGPIDPYRGFAAVNAYTVAFFDRHLKGEASPLLEGTSSEWPEVRFASKGAE